jgi:hypothetical protein
MAGDWIKVRTGLGRHPKVVRMASALKTDRLRVVGGLHAVWCLFDEHTTDGVLEGYTLELVDELIGLPGMAGAMLDVRWLDDSKPGCLVLPEFDTHNGASARRRAQDADRKRAERRESAGGADGKRTRGEKRRGDSSTPDGNQLPLGGLDDPPPPPLREGYFEGHAEDQAPVLSPAAPMAIALNRLGFRCTSYTPDLIAAAAEGVTVEHVLEIAGWAECRGKPATYVVAIARRENAERQNPPPQGVSHATNRRGSAVERIEAAVRAGREGDQQRGWGADGYIEGRADRIE